MCDILNARSWHTPHHTIRHTRSSNVTRQLAMNNANNRRSESRMQILYRCRELLTFKVTEFWIIKVQQNIKAERCLRWSKVRRANFDAFIPGFYRTVVENRPSIQLGKTMALSQSFAFVVVLIFAIQSGCLAAKFAMISMKGRSHYLVLERLGKELESRGHEVNSVFVVL